MTIKHEVMLIKRAGRGLSDNKVEAQLDAVVSSVNTGQRAQRGWQTVLMNQGYRRWTRNYNNEYRALLVVTCDRGNAKPSEFDNIVASIEKRAATQRWDVESVDGKKYVPPKVSEAEQANADIGYSPIDIPSNWDSYFSHLYGLDAHISRIRRALDAAIQSQWQHRFHCALIGPPGCGKSDICGSLKKALGDETVMEFDATSTTMAGAQKEIAEREELPRVIVVEEIEKAPDTSMQWLLSVLDIRGEIRKTTARGNIFRDARMLAVATVNDLPTFQKVAFGALQSRFSNKIYFNRPPRELLAKILGREIRRVDGKMNWIVPALDYASEIDSTDPREVIAIAMCGRDGLLDGSYQAEMRVTSPART